MTPDERRMVLRESLEQRRDSARDLARHEQNQRDEYTSKIRFGIVAFNAVSLVTVLNLVPIIPGFSLAEALSGSAFFFVGTFAGGISLVSHQTQLIRTTGKATVFAMHLERAVALCGFPVGSDEHTRLGTVLDEIDTLLEDDLYEAGTTALAAQSISLWSWVGGALALGLAQAASLLSAQPFS